jgi:hypothetical protein
MPTFHIYVADCGEVVLPDVLLAQDGLTVLCTVRYRDSVYGRLEER